MSTTGRRLFARGPMQASTGRPDRPGARAMSAHSPVDPPTDLSPRRDPAWGEAKRRIGR